MVCVRVEGLLGQGKLLDWMVHARYAAGSLRGARASGSLTGSAGPGGLRRRRRQPDSLGRRQRPLP